MPSAADSATERSTISDEEVVTRVLAGETELFEIVMRRYSQRLYRVAWTILRDDGEAEDVMQDACVRAYQHLGQFAGRAKFPTWLTRIAIHEALARDRKRARYQELDQILGWDGDLMERFESLTPNPEQQASNSEIREHMEEAVAKLPDNYRAVFTLRHVEEMSTIEVAGVLGITRETVKTRFHRARALLRKILNARAGMGARENSALMLFGVTGWLRRFSKHTQADLIPPAKATSTLGFEPWRAARQRH